MPIRYEPAAPVALTGNVYEQHYAEQLRRQNQQNAIDQQSHAAAGGYGHGGGASGGGDAQAAINHRDEMQFAQQRHSDEMTGVPQSQIFQAQAAAKMQDDKFRNEAALSQTQLTQQETMRLARIRNAIGDVQSDPSLSDQQKADFTVQLKTGESPLAHRQVAAKMAQDQQRSDQLVKETDLHAAIEKRKFDALGKSVDDSTAIVHDPKELAAIVDDLQGKIPADTPDRDNVIQNLAKRESIRQGTFTHVMTDATGHRHLFGGPGSKAHDAAAAKGDGSGGGGTERGALNEDKWLKIKGEVEKNFDHKANEMKEGEIFGTKVLSHPEFQDLRKRREAVIAELRDLKVPTTLEELHAHMDKNAKSGKGYGYDKSAAPWNKAAGPAAATTPAGDGAGANSPQGPPDSAHVGSINKQSNTEANNFLNDTRIPEAVRPRMAESVGVARRALASVGGDATKLTGRAKEEFEAARKFISQNDPERAGAPTAAAAPGGAPQPQEKSWWDKANAGELGKETLDIPRVLNAADLTNPETRANFGRGLDRIGEALPAIGSPDVSGSLSDLADNRLFRAADRLYQPLKRRKPGGR